MVQANRPTVAPSLRLANMLRLAHPMSVDLYVETVIAEAKLVVLRMLGGRSYWPYGLEQIAAACRAALPHLKKSPAGRIINVGFLRSVFAADGVQSFDRAEQNLAALTRALGAEIGEFGITANYVQPGAIMTPASREVFRKHMALRDHCITDSAAGRLGEPVDVAKVVLFLASDDAAFVSGTGVRVDGGRSTTPPLE